MLSSMEYRWGKRALVDVPARLRCCAGQVADGRIANISRSGALIRTDLMLARLTRVDIRTRFNWHRFARQHRPIEQDLPVVMCASAATTAPMESFAKSR